MEQYLIVRLHNERLGLNIRQTSEIIRQVPARRIPIKMNFLEGAIELRGHIVPLINLKMRLYEERNYDGDAVVVICHDVHNNRFACLVDEVLEVISIPDDWIEKPLMYAAADSQNIVTGIAKLENGLVVIINTENIIQSADMQKINKKLDKV